jgi:hypothetical protein
MTAGACGGFIGGGVARQAKLGTKLRGESRRLDICAFSPGRVMICASKSGASILPGRCSLSPAHRQLDDHMNDERHASIDETAVPEGDTHV